MEQPTWGHVMHFCDLGQALWRVFEAPTAHRIHNDASNEGRLDYEYIRTVLRGGKLVWRPFKIPDLGIVVDPENQKRTEGNPTASSSSYFLPYHIAYNVRHTQGHRGMYSGTEGPTIWPFICKMPNSKARWLTTPKFQ